MEKLIEIQISRFLTPESILQEWLEAYLYRLALFMHTVFFSFLWRWVFHCFFKISISFSFFEHKIWNYFLSYYTGALARGKLFSNIATYLNIVLLLFFTNWLFICRVENEITTTPTCTVSYSLRLNGTKNCELDCWEFPSYLSGSPSYVEVVVDGNRRLMFEVTLIGINIKAWWFIKRSQITQ